MTRPSRPPEHDEEPGRDGGEGGEGHRSADPRADEKEELRASREDARRTRRERRTVREERLSGRERPEFRVPAWVVIPLAVGAGWFVSGVPGGIFGLLAGLVLWWSRR